MKYSPAPSHFPDPPLIADHPVLDLLNTAAQIDGTAIEFLQSDADVLQWLRRTGFAKADEAAAFEPHSLCVAARALREVVRTLVAQRRAGEHVEVAALNAFLARGRYELELVADGDELRVVRRHEQRTPEQCLMPLAEAAAQLLAEGDFALVRKCESPDCTLYFYDRTKSHGRRWCSMAACGNRHKVASFRARREK
jgi:predicted RNA-binding Zn ribbon-like protein